MAQMTWSVLISSGKHNTALGHLRNLMDVHNPKDTMMHYESMRLEQYVLRRRNLSCVTGKYVNVHHGRSVGF